jgi:hypothetical protein
VCQALTKEVKEGDAEAGEFLNTLTGESHGTRVEFIPAFYQRGRAASMKDGRYLVAISQDLIPETWADLVGEEFVGTPFADFPDAEEQYKNRVNRKEIEWGKGPAISTTYNYTGLVLPEDPDGGEDSMPVRISFLRSTKSAHDKLSTLKKSTMRNKSWWDVAFELTTQEKTFGRNTSFVVNVKKLRETTAEEKARAVELATAVMRGNTQGNDEVAAEGRVERPEAAGGLAV